MSESIGATRTTLVLRLSVPASGALRALAAEMAMKVAEQAGAADTATLGAAVDEIAARVAHGTADQNIDFEFRRSGAALVIEARCHGRSAQARHPLPA